MELRILGPLEVVNEQGHPVPLGGSKPRALLARLLVVANEAVARDQLIEDLWSGEPPERASAALQTVVSRLRAAIRRGGLPDIVATTSHGYLVRVEADGLDATRFERLVAEGRRELKSEGWARGAAALSAGLALWRGSALADVAHEPFARGEVVRLEALRLGAIEDWVEAELALGHHQELVGELEALTGAHPLSERLWGQRMLALYRAHRQAEALRVYQALRGELTEQLGIEPSPTLQRLERDMLQQSPALEWHEPGPSHGVERSTSRKPRDERSSIGTVTVLFTDLVTSTAIASRLGPDASDRVRRSHFELLSETAMGAGGEVIKNLGDGLMIAFRSAADAITAAIAMQEAVAADNRTAAWELSMRIGIATGDATLEDGDLFGRPVVEAARLCAAATGAEILVSDVVRTLAEPRGHSFTSPRSLHLKGFAEASTVWDVTWRAADAPPFPPLPDDQTPFVGRDADVERLTHAWEAGKGGAIQLVVISGEPGVGKTRLAVEFCRDVIADGGRVLYGRCYEEPLGAYQPFMEAFRRDPHLPGFDELRQRAGRSRNDLLPNRAQVDTGDAELSHEDAFSRRYALFEEVSSAMVDAVVDRPLLLVLDDLHWATSPSLLLLKHLLRSPRATATLVIVTYRDTDVDASHPLRALLADLRRDLRYERLALSGLDLNGLHQFLVAMGAAASDDLSSGVVTALHSETAGNPFFVTELVLHLLETGALTARGAGPDFRADGLDIPEGVEDVIGRRVARLTADAGEVIRAAAVAGQEFSFGVLTGATGMDEEGLVDAIEELLASRIVVEQSDGVEGFAFSHGLVRETVYGQLAGPRRIRLHRRVGETIEALAGDDTVSHAAQLAHHFTVAIAAGVDPAKALRFTQEAGDAARVHLAYEEALGFYERGLELVESHRLGDEQSCRLELLAGRACHQAGQHLRAWTHFDHAAGLARRLQAPELLAQAAVGFAAWRGVGPDRPAVALLDEALAALPDADSVVRLRTLSAAANEHLFWGTTEHGQSLSSAALEMARRIGDARLLAGALNAHHFALMRTARPEDRLPLTEEATALADVAESPVAAYWAHVHRLIDHLEIGNLTEADAAVEACAVLGIEHRLPQAQWHAVVWRGMRALLAGRFAAAEDLALETLELGQRLQVSGAQEVFGAWTFYVRWEQARLAEMGDLLAATVEQAPLIPGFRAYQALLCAETDRTSDARHVLGSLDVELGDDRPRDSTWPGWGLMLGETYAVLGERERGARLYDLLLPFADRNLLAGAAYLCLGSSSRTLGRLAHTAGWPDRAAAHFERALELNERIGATAWLAHTRCDYGSMLLERAEAGDRERSIALLGAAATAAAELGMVALSERVAAVSTAEGLALAH